MILYSAPVDLPGDLGGAAKHGLNKFIVTRVLVFHSVLKGSVIFCIINVSTALSGVSAAHKQSMSPRTSTVYIHGRKKVNDAPYMVPEQQLLKQINFIGRIDLHLEPCDCWKLLCYTTHNVYSNSLGSRFFPDKHTTSDVH